MRTITVQSHPGKFWGISEVCQTQQQVRVPLHTGLSHTPSELVARARPPSAAASADTAALRAVGVGADRHPGFLWVPKTYCPFFWRWWKHLDLEQDEAACASEKEPTIKLLQIEMIRYSEVLAGEGTREESRTKDISTQCLSKNAQSCCWVL